MATRFVGLAHPRPALVDVSAPQPRRYYAALVSDLLRCSVPASRRPATLRAAVARHDLLRMPLSAFVALSRSSAHSDMDRVRHELIDGWSELAARSGRLPASAPDLSLLCLRRSLGWLVFVFGEPEHPLLVCKLPDGDDDPRVDDEAGVLTSVEAADVAPRFLGRVGRARVQEGLPGSPLRLVPLAVRDVATASWHAELADTADGLLRLAKLTVDRGVPPDTLSEEAEALLSPATAGTVRDSLQRLADADVSVLCHGDTSAQNVLSDGASLTGLVDWEFARRGLPGADVLNLAHAVFEQRLGLRRWREHEVLRAFGTAWAAAPLFREARAATLAGAEIVGLPGSLAHDLEIAVYARRLQRRVSRPGGYLVGPAMTASMLTTVCAH